MSHGTTQQIKSPVHHPWQAHKVARSAWERGAKHHGARVLVVRSFGYEDSWILVSMVWLCCVRCHGSGRWPLASGRPLYRWNWNWKLASYRQMRTTIRNYSTRSDWWHYWQRHPCTFWTRFLKIEIRHETGQIVSYRQMRTTIRHSSTRSDWWYYWNQHRKLWYITF